MIFQNRRDTRLLHILLPLGIVAVTVLLATLMPIFGLAFISGLLALAASYVLVTRPWSAFGLYLFLLPAHVPLMAILFVIIGLPAMVVKGISAWKEILLILLLLIAAWRIYAVDRLVIRLALPDYLAGLYVLFLAIVSTISLFQIESLVAWAYGLRDALLPLLLYAIGRTLAITEKTARFVFVSILLLTAIVSIIGIIERLFIPTTAHVALGLPIYYRELLGVHFPDYLMGLPSNFWTSANSGTLRRAVSVYGSSQSFAISFLLALPICIYSVLDQRIVRRPIAWFCLVIALAGLVLTLTRFTIAICFLLLFLALWLGNQRSRQHLMIALVLATLLGIGSFLFIPRFQLLVINTITFEDHTSSFRLIIWAETIRFVLDNPLGAGLAATGLTAARMGTEALPIEGQYSKVVLEQGILGLILYGIVLISMSAYLMRAAFRSTHLYRRGLCFALALTSIGLSLNSIMTEWHNSIALVYPTFLLIGAAVRYAVQQEFEPDRGDSIADRD